jgi:hypothetical protein
MRKLPSPITGIVCGHPLNLSGAAAASTSPVTSPRAKWTPLLYRIGKVEVSKSGYGFTQEPTEVEKGRSLTGLVLHGSELVYTHYSLIRIDINIIV